ncbi:MAG: sigma-70 family RNA polymerase sigma factor [Planctomycetota bacterium]
MRTRSFNLGAENLNTSPTLLGQLRHGPSDEDWQAFVDRYAPTVFSWAWQSGLQESDAADVTQEVLLKLLEQMKSFEYDQAKGSFRGWLKTITVNAARDLGRKIQRRPAGEAGLSGVQDPHMWDELARRMESEYQSDLIEQANALVKPRVAENTWRAYELTAVQNQPAPAVATTLGMKVSEVYVAKSRVIKRIREAVAELERIDSGER